MQLRLFLAILPSKMILSLLFSLVLCGDSPTNSPTPAPTDLPAGPFAGLLASCFAVSGVCMVVIGFIALRFMKSAPNADEQRQNLISDGQISK